ncbi:MAG: flagellar assembly protein FliW [Nitrospiria bacterium]
MTFPDGILGFPSLKKYLLIEYEKGHPLLWLQSVENNDLGFVVIDPLIVKPAYRPEIASPDLLYLKAKGLKDLVFLSIVNLPKDDPIKLSANLMAPLVINYQLRRGRQIVLNESGYPIREPIIKFPMKKQEMVSSRLSVNK